MEQRAFELMRERQMEDQSLYPLRQRVREVLQAFPAQYWRERDLRREYPEAFVQRMIEERFLAAMIPEGFGGLGMGLLEASVILEEVNRSGGNAGPAHAQMYMMGILLRHGSEEQKRRLLPAIANGAVRLQAFGVTEPDAGTDTTHIRTRAVRRGDRYVVDGEKIFISRVQHSDYLLLLVRTTPLEEVEKPSRGLSLLLVDLRESIGRGLEVFPIATMINNETNRLVFHGLEVPTDNLVGREGEGFRYLLDGLNAERILIAAECVGDGYWFLDQATHRARERHVFGRPIGANQGVAFPLAQAYAKVRAADLMRFEAARRFDQGLPCGEEANLAKHLAAEASWEAANTALQTFGGYGFARDYDIERKFRETRLYLVAPISTNLVLAYIAEHVLSLPRSY